MGITLVTHVPDEVVAREVERAVQGQRQLDHAEVRGQVAAGLGDGLGDERADLAGQADQFRRRHAAQVAGRVNVIQETVAQRRVLQSDSFSHGYYYNAT